MAIYSGLISNIVAHMFYLWKRCSSGQKIDPLLFLIFSRFPKFCMYSDDTSIFCSSKNKYYLSSRQYLELVKINPLFVDNQLITLVNKKKTAFSIYPEAFMVSWTAMVSKVGWHNQIFLWPYTFFVIICKRLENSKFKQYLQSNNS